MVSQSGMIYLETDALVRLLADALLQTHAQTATQRSEP